MFCQRNGSELISGRKTALQLPHDERNHQAKAKRPMALNVQKKPDTRPRRTMIYGVHGIGKSTFGAMMPNPIFIQTEDGIGDIEADRLPMCDSLDTFYGQLGDVIQEEHNYKSLVIDSADWLENLISAAICKKHNKTAIAEFDYGKGPPLVAAEWKTVLDGLTQCINRGMSVLLLAHSQVVTFNDPTTNSYDRYSPKLVKHSAALIQEWCDEVLFATRKVFTTSEDLGFNKTRAVATNGADARVLKTTEAAGWLAKNRLAMPPEIPFAYVEYAKHLK